MGGGELPLGLPDVQAEELGLPDVQAEALGLPDAQAEESGLPDVQVEEAGLLVWSPGQDTGLDRSTQESQRKFTVVKIIFNSETHAKVMQTFIYHLHYCP